LLLNKIKGDWHILKLKDLVTKDRNLISNLAAIGFTEPEIDALKLIDEFPEVKSRKQKEKLTLF